jgi:hypothetical protein
MRKDLLALALTLSLAACGGESSEAPVHAAEGAQPPAAKGEAGSSLLDQTKGLASQENVAQAQKAFEQQLGAVGARIESFKQEAGQATGEAKASASQLADKLGQRFAEAKKRYEAWKAEGSGDVNELVDQLTPLLQGIDSDLEAALTQIQD